MHAPVWVALAMASAVTGGFDGEAGTMIGEEPATYRNPVVRGLSPDPSVCRVGDDYYLATSSMFLYPGVPIHHSRDLVHWRLIGHALTTRAHFCLDRNGANPMMYAPTLRHHDGTFYLITTDVHGGGNFYVTATDPAGSWSDPFFVDQPVFDPSLFFDDDGTVYYTRRGDLADKDIVQAEIDVATGRLLTPLRSIGKGLISNDTEAPHLFKADGWYYLTCGEGGSRFLHMQTIGRSRSPWGPFEPCPHNPIIAQHNAWWHPIRSLGHADFVEDHAGKWWAVCLGTRHAGYDRFSNIGRETFLFPLRWEDGWPVFDEQHFQDYPVHAPTLGLRPWPEKPARDDFDAPELARHWTRLAYPVERTHSLAERPGWLRLFGQPGPLAEATQVAFVGRRQTEVAARFETAMAFEPTAPGEEAGVSVFLKRGWHYDFCKTLRDGAPHVVLRKYVGDIVHEAASRQVAGDALLRLRIEAGPEDYAFHFAEGDGEWTLLGRGLGQLITTEVAATWSGVLLGMYAAGGDRPCASPADFDWAAYQSSRPR